MRLHFNMSIKQKSIVVLVAIVCVVGVALGTHSIFHYMTRRQLVNDVNARILELKRDLNREIVLALQMAFSPAVVDYLSDPSNEEKEALAFNEFKEFENSFLSHITFWISDKDLRYHSNGEYLYTLDKSLANSYWYERAFAKETYLFNVNYDPGLQKVFLWIDIPVYDKLKQRAGITGTGIPIRDFVNALYDRVDEDETMYLYNDLQEVVGATDIAYLEEKCNILTLLPDLKKFNCNLMSDTMQFYSSLKGEYVIAPIEELDWYLVLFIPFTPKAFIEHSAFPIVLLLVFVVFFLIERQNRMYHNENTIIRIQKQEIEKLNESQTRFFASMSHEIRTPINTIIGLDEMILRENISDEVAEDARNIAGASKMLLSLINDILDMSKIESDKMELVSAPYETKSMFLDLVNMVWIRAKEKALVLHVQIDPSLPSVLKGDEVRIKQILLNLLNNAIKYTREGSVSFAVRCEMCGDQKTRLICSVSDTGIGIKKENIPYLFDAFKRVENQNNHLIEGTGLGLTIVKQLITLMKGTITVDSIYTKGSTFTVTIDQDIIEAIPVGDLKIAVGHAMYERRLHEKVFEAPLAQVLIVDDNSMNLMVAKKLLRETKMQIDTAPSAAVALSLTLNKCYNVILMDHLMPEMDGIECLHEIRKQIGGANHDTPVIVLTANAGEKERLLYEREGFDGYLTKPVSGLQLENAVVDFLPPEIVQYQTLQSDGSKLLISGNYNRIKKVPVIISTDSVCDLPQELIKKYDIPILPYRVRTKDGIFLDGIEIDAAGMLFYLDHNGITAFSDCPSVQDYERFFAQLLERAQSVVHITMSRKVSEGYNHACTAAQSFNNIKIIDSEQVSSSTGLQVLWAIDCLKQYGSVDMVLQELQANKKIFSTLFLVDSLAFLSGTGRISRVLAGLCDSLLLRPAVEMRNGRISLGGFYFGPQNFVRERYIHSLLAHPSTIDDSILFIVHVGLSESELDAIKKQVLKYVAFKQIYFQSACPAIASNAGRGAFGLLFMKKTK